ncbi:hypothetical protein J437_LFUL017480 [Ladona fulva]|uniref:Uncharacterized protein n=1 Tax=Ladona fulva TaxID=123851 RepID=A0A8K0PBJ8_LADFU|nr:hypothetical protein J437_LFUL017480 [Ladona fulva]
MSAKKVLETNYKQLKWYGRLRRTKEERMPLKVWEWTPVGRNKRGRPRKKWRGNIGMEMRRRGLTISIASEM